MGEKPLAPTKKIGPILGESLGGAWGAGVPRPGRIEPSDGWKYTFDCGSSLIGSWLFREICC